MRVLFIAGYQHPIYHRKVELLTDAPDLELLHITNDHSDRPTGIYLSANGQKHYELRTFPGLMLGRADDPHRSLLRTFDFCIQQFQPDLIHAESDLETLGTMQVALAAQLFARHSKLVLYTWQNILRPSRLVLRLLVNWLLYVTDHIFCASHEAVDVLHRQGFAGSTSVLPLVGVDRRSSFAQPVPKLRETLGLSGTVLGYVGRLVQDKGIDLFIRAVAQLPQPIALLIVGSGPLQTQLQELVADLGLSGRCRFIGNVAPEEVPRYMNIMDILVLPSRTTTHWKEQFGRVLVEAMACKVAVVGSDSGAIPEVIGDGGRIFKENDLVDLTRVLNELVTNTTLRQTLANQGYQRVEAHYTAERVAEQTLQVWRKLTGNVTR